MFRIFAFLQVNWLYTATDVMSTMRAAQLKANKNKNNTKINSNNHRHGR